MRKFLTFFCLLFIVLTTNVYGQRDGQYAGHGVDGELSIHVGYSWLNGVVGVDYQYKNFGLSAGFLPTKMPATNDFVGSYSGAVTYYGKFNESSGRNRGYAYYLSAGVASAGYREQSSYGGGSWSRVVEPMTIIMFGSRGYSEFIPSGKNLFGKFGLGYGWSQSAGGVVTAEFIIGLGLFN